MKRRGAGVLRSGGRERPHQERHPSILDLLRAPWLIEEQQAETGFNMNAEAPHAAEPGHTVEDATSLACSNVPTMSASISMQEMRKNTNKQQRQKQKDESDDNNKQR